MIAAKPNKDTTKNLLQSAALSYLYRLYGGVLGQKFVKKRGEASRLIGAP
jgi:hypothetical protein